MVVGLVLAFAAQQSAGAADVGAALPGPTQATVRVELAVTEVGRVDGCKVVESDAPPALGERMCGVLIEKARFAPKLDAQGKATRTTVTQTIRFALQD